MKRTLPTDWTLYMPVIIGSVIGTMLGMSQDNLAVFVAYGAGIGLPTGLVVRHFKPT